MTDMEKMLEELNEYINDLLCCFERNINRAIEEMR